MSVVDQGRVEMKNLVKNIFIVGLITGSFVFGLSTGVYKHQPFNLLQTIKHVLTEGEGNQFSNEIFYKEIINKEKEKIKNTFDIPELLNTRDKIIENYILDPTQVKINQKDSTSSCLGDVKEINTNFYGINQRGLLKQNNSKKLLIFIQGHFPGNPCDEDDVVELYKKFSSDYDFLVLSMFNMGLNLQKKISFPIKINSSEPMEYFRENLPNYQNHSSVRYFFDPNHPQKKPLSIFISSQYYTIKSLLKDYDEVVLSGLSGGGWYTSVLGGLIPEIKKTFSFKFCTSFSNCLTLSPSLRTLSAIGIICSFFLNPNNVRP